MSNKRFADHTFSTIQGIINGWCNELAAQDRASLVEANPDNKKLSRVGVDRVLSPNYDPWRVDSLTFAYGRLALRDSGLTYDNLVGKFDFGKYADQEAYFIRNITS